MLSDSPYFIVFGGALFINFSGIIKHLNLHKTYCVRGF